MPSLTASSVSYHLQRWYPVFAIGSNAGPRQLLRKYGGEAYAWPKMDCVIPCLRVTISGFDVVSYPRTMHRPNCHHHFARHPPPFSQLEQQASQ